MSALYMIAGTLIALGVLVTFHEFGHFWVARRCGVKVLRFSVGFGMPLLRWHDKQGTEFVVAAIPLGGYVKMLDEREGEVPADQLHQSFNRKSVRQRIAIVAAGPIANFLLALVFFWVLAMLGSEQIRPVIGAVESGSIAAKAGLNAGQEIVAIDASRLPAGRPSICSWSVVLGKAVPCNCSCESRALPLTRRANWRWITGSKGLMNPIRFARWVFAHGARPCRRCWPSSIQKVRRRPLV